MNTLLCPAQGLLARRAVPWCNAPRGTPSRLLKVRLDRSFHRNGAEQSGQPSLQPAAADASSSPIIHAIPAKKSREPTPECVLDADELGVLRNVFRVTGSVGAALRKAQQRTAAHAAAGGGTAKEAHRQTDDEKAGLVAAVPELTRVLSDPYSTAAFLKQLLSNAYRKVDLEDPNGLLNMPPMVFSEMLRSLDPVEVISQQVDPTAGIRIGPGMAERTSLGEYVDVYGVRKIYVLLFRRVLAAIRLRLDAGRQPLRSDYIVLIRLAGASSDAESASAVRRLITQCHEQLLYDGGLQAEYLQARFLTTPLYTQYDASRLRVRAVNLFKRKDRSPAHLDPATRTALRRLRRGIAKRQTLRYGHNRYRPEIVEELARVTRNTRPVFKNYRALVEGRISASEEVLSALLIAFGRNASARAIMEILDKFWHIKVVRSPSGELVVNGAANFRPRPDSTWYPSEHLLEAIVESLGAQGDLQAALRLVDHISRRFSIPVTNKIWKRLLQWSYILSQKSVRLEWKTAGFENKQTPSLAVETIWGVMTSPPYNVQPGLAEYSILIRTLLAQGRSTEALHRMLELYPYYKDILQHLEGQFHKYVSLCRMQVDRSSVRKEWLEAQVHKDEAWHQFQHWVHTLLKKLRPVHADQDIAVRLIPKLIDAFRPVLPDEVRYRISSGIVEIHNAQPIQRFIPIEGERIRPAWVTDDLVARPRQGDMGTDQAWATPGLTHEQRRQLKPQALTRRRAKASVDVAAKFASPRPLSSGWIQRLFT